MLCGCQIFKREVARSLRETRNATSHGKSWSVLTGSWFCLLSESCRLACRASTLRDRHSLPHTLNNTPLPAWVLSPPSQGTARWALQTTDGYFLKVLEARVALGASRAIAPGRCRGGGSFRRAAGCWGSLAWCGPPSRSLRGHAPPCLSLPVLLGGLRPWDRAHLNPR